MQNCAISKLDILYVCDFRSTSVPVEVTVTPLGTRPPVIDAAAFTISVSEAVPIGSSLWTVPVCIILHISHKIFSNSITILVHLPLWLFHINLNTVFLTWNSDFSCKNHNNATYHQ